MLLLASPFSQGFANALRNAGNLVIIYLEFSDRAPYRNPKLPKRYGYNSVLSNGAPCRTVDRQGIKESTRFVSRNLVAPVDLRPN